MKKALKVIIFSLLIVFILQGINDIVVSKPYNRYYILEKHLECEIEESVYDKIKEIIEK